VRHVVHRVRLLCCFVISSNVVFIVIDNGVRREREKERGECTRARKITALDVTRME